MLLAALIAVGAMSVMAEAIAQGGADIQACAALAAKVAPILKATPRHEVHIKPTVAFALERPDGQGAYEMGLACVYGGRRIDFDLLKSPDAPATTADRELFIRAAVALGVRKDLVASLMAQCEKRRRKSQQDIAEAEGERREALSCGKDGWTLR